MQYVFSMTSRMVTIAVSCALLLCVLLFVLGFEIGARFVVPEAPAASAVPLGAAASLRVPVADGSALSASPAGNDAPADPSAASGPSAASTN
jgi:hypothetical protein